MALNPNIPLSVQQAQPFNALLTGHQARQQQERGAKQNQLLDLQASGQQMQNDRASAENEIRSSYEGALGLVSILGQEGEVTPDRLDNARSYMQNRIAAIESRGGNTEGSRRALDMLNAGGIEELRQAPSKVQDIMIKTGMLKAPQNQGFTLGQGQQRYDAAGNLIASGADKDPQGFTLGEGQQRFNANNTLVASGGAKTPTNQKTTDIKNFDFAKEQGFEGSFNDFMKQGKGASKAEEEELKATVKANVERLSDLKKTKKTRDSSIVKARRFLRAFESGDAESGTTRTVAGFLPGVFTDQAQFDQELDAFAEVAAREKLKAVGEIRPTDADVEGMKRALFGVGRDEKVNIQLLREFISEQENQNDELEDLIEAKKRGSLSTFTGGRGPNNNLKELSDEELLNF